MIMNKERAAGAAKRSAGTILNELESKLARLSDIRDRIKEIYLSPLDPHNVSRLMEEKRKIFGTLSTSAFYTVNSCPFCLMYDFPDRWTNACKECFYGERHGKCVPKKEDGGEENSYQKLTEASEAMTKAAYEYWQSTDSTLWNINCDKKEENEECSKREDEEVSELPD